MKTKKLLNREKIADLPENPGVYRIYAYSNEEPIEINRFANKDKQGLLYIGRTKNLKARLNNFLLSSDTNKRTHNHSGALKYRNNHIIREALKNHTICFEYFELDEDVIKNKETELLNQYSSLFGEYPPLNK